MCPGFFSSEQIPFLGQAEIFSSWGRITEPKDNKIMDRKDILHVYLLYSMV